MKPTNDNVEVRQITDRAEWLEWRKANINGSEIGALCNLSKYSNARHLAHRKNGSLPEMPATAIMERGNDFEAVVITKAKRAHPDWKIHQPGVYLSDPALRIGCTPDA